MRYDSKAHTLYQKVIVIQGTNMQMVVKYRCTDEQQPQKRE